jgi:nucleoid DNA-binding protein
LIKVEKIINHQFKFVSKIIKKGGFKAVRLPYFGRFSVKENRVKAINRLKSKKDEIKR